MPSRATWRPQAQLDLSKAQSTQTSARLEELQINLAQHQGHLAGRRLRRQAQRRSRRVGLAERAGRVGRRHLAPAARRQRRREGPAAGQRRRPGQVEVDAFPGEKFKGRIARVSPVLDPATRTAPMEVEIPNTDNRLKPGMYAKVLLTIEERKDTTLVPEGGAWSTSKASAASGCPEDENKARVHGGRSSGSRTPSGSEILEGVKPRRPRGHRRRASLRAGDTMVAARRRPRRRAWRGRRRSGAARRTGGRSRRHRSRGQGAAARGGQRRPRAVQRRQQRPSGRRANSS